MTSHTATSAGSFIGSLGVEAHISYTDGKYVNVTNMINDMNYLGLDLIRSSSLNSSGTLLGQQHYQAMASAGFKFDFVVNGNKPIQDTLSLLDAFETKNPGSIAAIEGPNEIDHQPITYEGLTKGAAAIAFQNDLYTAIKADPILSGVSVYSFSLGSGATPAGGYDAVALHPYPQNGDEPLRAFHSNLNLAPIGSQTVLSEFGYSTLPNWWMGVDQATQAKETLNGLFDAKLLGVQSTYLYELLDAYADPSNNLGNYHYGLFDYNNNPKTVAVAIHNLTSILADPHWQTTAVHDSLDYNITNLPSTASSLLLEKSNGTFDIVVWNEPDIWNQSTHTPIAAGTVSASLDLGGTYSSVKVFDPLVSNEAVQTLTNTSHVDLGLTDHPIIIEVTGASHAVADSTITSIEGTSGNDRLQGDTGIYEMSGHVGNDIYYVSNSADQIFEAVNEGTDRILTTVSYQLQAGQSVEYLYTTSPTGTDVLNLTGNEFGQIIQGNAGDNVLDGGAGNDKIYGLDGNDHLIGGDGNDLLSGGAGANILEGGAGNDTYTVSTSTDQVIEQADSGIDVVNSSVAFQLGANVEDLSLTGSSAINGTGNELDNKIVGNAGDNVLDGGAGNDSLYGQDGNDHLLGGDGKDILNGGGGTNILEGGAGDDKYVVTNASDTVVEQKNSGTDLVVSTVSFTLGANVDNLTLTGSSAVDGYGNELDNKILGNNAFNTLAGGDGADTIAGGAGDDIISGGLGKDRLIGGDGADTFVFAHDDSTASVYDVIADFKHGVDKIDLSFLPSDWHGEGYASTWVGSNSYSAVLASAQSLMQSAHADVAFVAGKSSGWLFWDDNQDHHADHAVMLSGLGAADMASFLANPTLSIYDLM